MGAYGGYSARRSVGYWKPTDAAQIALGIRPILHHRRPAYDFELGDLGEIIEDLILHAVRKVGVTLVIAEALERQDRDAFSVGTASVTRWLNKNAAPEKKNQAISAPAKHKPAANNQRTAWLLDFLFEGFAVTSALTDRNSSVVNRNPESIASLTFVTAFSNCAGF
jgi:hypothetical protein